MTDSTHLAAVHFRINMAGAAAENAIAAFNNGRVEAGITALKAVISDLSHAASYLLVSAEYEKRRAYVQDLIAFYGNILSSINSTTPLNSKRPVLARFTVSPSYAKDVATEIYNNQGNLLSADPF